MAANTDELDEELDDPISLMDFEDFKMDIKVEDQTPSVVIDLDESTDDESTYTSSYGKRDFVLPVTFFNMSRNVRLLNKCKPLNIKVVDCKQHPSYYTQYIKKQDLNDDFVEKDGTRDCENKPNNVDDVVNNDSKRMDKAENKQSNGRTHGDTFYEKLMAHKERKKQIALNSMNLSQIDLKRNKGLIGLKITGNIFKKIVETENAFIKTKKNCSERNSKGNNGTQKTKTNSAEGKSDKTVKSAVENPSSKTKNKSADNKSKEKHANTVSNKTEDKSAEDKTKEVSKSSADIVVKTKTDSVEVRPKEKSEIDTGNVMTKIKSSTSKNKAKQNSEIESGSELARAKKTSNEDKIVHIFNCFDTSVLPIANTNTHVSQNVDVKGDNVHTSTKVHAERPHVKDKQDNSRCSLHLPKDKIIKKSLKHKKAKTSKTTSPNKTVEHQAKDTPKDDNKVPKLSLKRSNSHSDNFYVSSCKKQSKTAQNTDVGKSGEAEQVDEAIINKNTNITRKQEGSNSPVIPCTTLNVSRASNPPNVAKDSSTSNQTSSKTLIIVEYKSLQPDPLISRLSGIENNGAAGNTAGVKDTSSSQVFNTNHTKSTTVLQTQVKPPVAENTVFATNQTINGLNKNQVYPNQSNNLPAFIRPRSYGGNAIILRKPLPSFRFPNMFPKPGQPIETVINHRPQNQSIPMPARQIKCLVAPRYPPPNSNNLNYAQPRFMNPNNFPNFRMPSAPTFRAIRGPSITCPLRPGYPGPTRYRFPPPPPPPPPGPPPLQDSHKNNPGTPTPTATIPHVSKDSIIGNTNTGELIKKINIVARPVNNVKEKEMMLAELNNAIMSPELTVNNPEDNISNDLKRNVDPRSSKPCPLSKKNNNIDLNPVKHPVKLPVNVGYSPPILPIHTYQETLQILSQKGKNEPKPVQSRVNAKCSGLNINNKKQKIHCEEDAQDKAKKISFEDYKKRVTKRACIDVNKIRKFNEFQNHADDYNQDQGYDSDSTVIL